MFDFFSDEMSDLKLTAKPGATVRQWFENHHGRSPRDVEQRNWYQCFERFCSDMLNIIVLL